jgi:hypothetical protein
MNSFDEQLFGMIGRLRTSNSKAAAVVTPCQMIVSNNPERDNKSVGPSVPLSFFWLYNPQKIVIIRNYISSLTMPIVPLHFLSLNPACAGI